MNLESPLPFIYTYPERLYNYLTINGFYPLKEVEPRWVDQIQQMADRLNYNKGTNRAVAVLYNPGVDSTRTDIPCLNWIQATIRDDGNLALHVMFRSNDLYGAFPSNMYLITYIGLRLAEMITAPVFFEGIYYHSSSLHIYKTNLDEVKKVLDE